MTTPKDVAVRPCVVDEIVLVCNGCGARRRFVLDKHLTSGEQLVEWMKTHPTPCACGARTCDVRAHIKDVETKQGAKG